MEVFVVSILFAALSGATCSVVAWPGAVPLSASGAVPLSASYVHSVIPTQVKSFGYSTSQYINAAPPSLAIGYQPQISYQSYQIPVSHYIPQQIQTYRPIVAPAYYPPASLLYPTLTPSPTIPISPVQQPQAEVPSYPTQGDEDTAVVDSAEFPQQAFPTQPQPGSGYLPPQNNPIQEPTQSYPTPSPPQSQPAAGNNDHALNGEDSISVESA